MLDNSAAMIIQTIVGTPNCVVKKSSSSKDLHKVDICYLTVDGIRCGKRKKLFEIFSFHVTNKYFIYLSD